MYSMAQTTLAPGKGVHYSRAEVFIGIWLSDLEHTELFLRSSSYREPREWIWLVAMSGMVWR